MIQERLSSSVVSVSDDDDLVQPPRVRPHFMLQYSYVEDVEVKRAPHRASHLGLASQYKRDGRLVMGGAYSDMSGAVAVFRTREDAQAFVDSDPYVKNGIVTKHMIQEWSVVV